MSALSEFPIPQGSGLNTDLDGNQECLAQVLIVLQAPGFGVSVVAVRLDGLGAQANPDPVVIVQLKGATNDTVQSQLHASMLSI